MTKERSKIEVRVCIGAILVLLATLAGCSREPEIVTLKKLAPGAVYAGFLSNYSSLKPNANFENTVSYLKQDDATNVHKYFAVIVEPVQIYLSTNADVSKIPDRGRTAMSAYFQHAITQAVSDAF